MIVIIANLLVLEKQDLSLIMEAWSDIFLYHIDMPFVNYLEAK